MIIPRPVTIEPRAGRFRLDARPAVHAGAGAERPAALLATYLARGGPAPLAAGHSGSGSIRLEVAGDLARLGPEGYILDITPDEVAARAPAAAGLFHAVQTLRQLRDGGAWPCQRIIDHPRLPWRGLMIDVARHFMPVDFLRTLIDEAARYKLNTLHLHLTDDQGWRMEIDGWPRLTSVGAWRRPAPETVTLSSGSVPGRQRGALDSGGLHGGYYTRAQLRGLVAFAADRGVTVVPEIEMPGHAQAAIAAYPALGNTPDRPVEVWNRWGVSEHILSVDDATLDFCRDVLDQIMEVFPAPYAHIGGDECPTMEWAASPAARARMAALGLDDPSLLHRWFLGRMRDHIAARGRQAICWDETGAQAELPDGVILTAWRDPRHGAAAVERGHQVIMAPHLSTYLDYAQSADPDEPPGPPGRLLRLPDVYAFDPLAGGLPVATGTGPGVLGTQAQIWTEYAPTPEHVSYLVFPRLCALAEVAWSPPDGDYADFARRLDLHQATAVGAGHRRNA